MTSCPTCFHDVPAPPRGQPAPDPDEDTCVVCGEAVCPHCAVAPEDGPPYRHKQSYCAESEEE
jgi:hypothetical protein